MPAYGHAYTRKTAAGKTAIPRNPLQRMAHVYPRTALHGDAENLVNSLLMSAYGCVPPRVKGKGSGHTVADEVTHCQARPNTVKRGGTRGPVSRRDAMSRRKRPEGLVLGYAALSRPNY